MSIFLKIIDHPPLCERIAEFMSYFDLSELIRIDPICYKKLKPFLDSRKPWLIGGPASTCVAHVWKDNYLTYINVSVTNNREPFNIYIDYVDSQYDAGSQLDSAIELSPIGLDRWMQDNCSKLVANSLHWQVSQYLLAEAKKVPLPPLASI